MSIYTKRGDTGATSILIKKGSGVISISKASPLIDAIGSVDEANSYLGIITSELKTQNLKLKGTTQNSKDIEKVQRNLFTVGSILAGARNRFDGGEITKVDRFCLARRIVNFFATNVCKDAG
jgi:cob(I)alamin adenosyltransferase